MRNPHHVVLRCACLRASKNRRHKCVCVHAFLQLCKVGDLVRDPGVSQLSQHRPPIFIFQEVLRRIVHSHIVTWAAEGNNCSSYLMCFCASSAFVPFNESKEGKNRSTCGYMCVYCVALCVCLRVSKHCVVVWGLCEGGFLPINQTQYKQTQ